VCVCACVCVRACERACVTVCVCACVCMYVRENDHRKHPGRYVPATYTNTHINTYTHICTNTHARIRAHTHTRKHQRSKALALTDALINQACAARHGGSMLPALKHSTAILSPCTATLALKANSTPGNRRECPRRHYFCKQQEQYICSAHLFRGKPSSHACIDNWLRLLIRSIVRSTIHRYVDAIVLAIILRRTIPMQRG